MGGLPFPKKRDGFDLNFRQVTSGERLSWILWLQDATVQRVVEIVVKPFTLHLSHEKRAPGWLGFIGDEILSMLYGDCNKLLEVPIKQPV